jgi:transketolase
MRNYFAQEITKLAQKNKKIILLSGDIGNRIFDKFKKKFPDRFYNCGIAEANMTGVAAGLAKLGFQPITYTIATFNTLRCLEQIKLDLCYTNSKTIIVGTGAGLSYSSLGSTHHSLEDISILRSMPNLTIFCPSDPEQVKIILRKSLKISGPVYIRLGKKNEPIFTNRKKIGDADLIVNGKKNLFISVGNILEEVMDASKQLLKNYQIKSAVLDLVKVKPLSSNKLKNFIQLFDKIFIVEEHYITGGAGSALVEWLEQTKKEKQVIIKIGIKNEFIHGAGNQKNAREKVGISSKQIIKKFLKVIKK